MTNIICNECETVAHCMKNGCIPKQQALNKMADNARKLGLDYEPAQQEPVTWMHPDGRIWTFGRGLDKSTFTVPLYTSPPAQQEQGELRRLKEANQVMLAALKLIAETDVIDAALDPQRAVRVAQKAIAKGEKT